MNQPTIKATFRQIRQVTTGWVILLLLGAIPMGCVPRPSDQKIPKAVETTITETDRMAWWQEARFGMFIHWGAYSSLGGEYQGQRTEGLAEWIMNDLQIPIREYETVARAFDPQAYNATEWVKLAKAAGMKYIILTSKHHDGFCLWDSEVTPYNIVDHTTYKKDVIEALANACKQEGIKLGLYHSIMDWHHPAAQARWEPRYDQREEEGGKANPDFQQYYDQHFLPQVKELLTNFEDLAILWFDGEWIPDYTTEMGKQTYEEILKINPRVLVNNRVDKGRQGMQGMNKEGNFAGDFGTPEQEIPDQGLEGVDWEACMTMNESWGYKHFDDDWKSDTLLIQNLVDIVSKGGNYLLNVGPDGKGRIPAESVERLQTIGQWMDENGAAIYGTTASPFKKPAWGRYTQKGNYVYAFVFDWPLTGLLEVDSRGSTINNVYALSDAAKIPLELTQTEGSYHLHLPETPSNPYATVLVLETESNPSPTQSAN